MIELGNNFLLDSDDKQLILRKRQFKQEGKHKGDEYMTVVGYYGSTSQLVSALLDRRLYEAVRQFVDINEIVSEMEEFTQHLRNTFKGAATLTETANDQ